MAMRVGRSRPRRTTSPSAHRRAEHAQRGVALELVDEPVVLVHRRHDGGEELVEDRDDPLRALAVGERRRADDVDEQGDTSQVAPPSVVPRSSASRATSAPTWRP
jgi:hypothetical protein